MAQNKRTRALTPCPAPRRPLRCSAPCAAPPPALPPAPSRLPPFPRPPPPPPTSILKRCLLSRFSYTVCIPKKDDEDPTVHRAEAVPLGFIVVGALVLLHHLLLQLHQLFNLPSAAPSSPFFCSLSPLVFSFSTTSFFCNLLPSAPSSCSFLSTTPSSFSYCFLSMLSPHPPCAARRRQFFCRLLSTAPSSYAAAATTTSTTTFTYNVCPPPPSTLPPAPPPPLPPS